MSTTSIFLRIAPDLLREIDAYRRAQENPPPRTKAAEHFIKRGIEKEQQDKKPNRKP